MPYKLAKMPPRFILVIDTGEGTLALAGEAESAKDVLTLADEAAKTVTPESVYIYHLTGSLKVGYNNETQFLRMAAIAR